MKWFIYDLNTGKTRLPTSEERKLLDQWSERIAKAVEQGEWKC